MAWTWCCTGTRAVAPISARDNRWAGATIWCVGRSRDGPIGWTEETYASLPEELEVREVEVTIHRKGFRPVKLIIITTLLDAQEYLPEDLAEVYWQRWQAELDLRSIKETMQMGELRCKTPAMVRKEIWAHFLAYNLIRGMIAQASAEHGQRPCQISFKGALQTLNAFQYVLSHSHDVQETYRRLLTAIATHRVGDRPGRVEPRAKKRRKKNYAVLTQPRPPGPKTFDENNLKPRKCHWGNALGNAVLV